LRAGEFSPNHSRTKFYHGMCCRSIALIYETPVGLFSIRIASSPWRSCNSAPAIPKLIFKIEWPQLIELMGLIERKPGIEAAIGDLFAAAEALVVDRTACL